VDQQNEVAVGVKLTVGQNLEEGRISNDKIVT